MLLLVAAISTIGLMLNPDITDKDFDLMFRIGRGEKTYKDGRNLDIDDGDFLFNEQVYFNDTTNTKLVIHSLDILKGDEEKVIFVLGDMDKCENSTVYIDYMNRESHRFSVSEIQFKKDSIYLWKKWNNQARVFIFNGKRIHPVCP